MAAALLLCVLFDAAIRQALLALWQSMHLGSTGTLAVHALGSTGTLAVQALRQYS